MNGSKGRGLDWRPRTEADGKTQTGRLGADQGPCSEGLQGPRGVELLVGCEVREAGN